MVLGHYGPNNQGLSFHSWSLRLNRTKQSTATRRQTINFAHKCTVFFRGREDKVFLWNPQEPLKQSATLRSFQWARGTSSFHKPKTPAHWSHSIELGRVSTFVRGFGCVFLDVGATCSIGRILKTGHWRPPISQELVDGSVKLDVCSGRKKRGW